MNAHPPATAFDEAFSQHFEAAYPQARASFEEYKPAYHFGRQRAYEVRFAGRSYAEAEKELRILYDLQHPSRPFEEVKAAIGFGYTQAQATLPPDGAHPLTPQDEPPRTADEALLRGGEKDRRPATVKENATGLSPRTPHTS